MKWLAALFLGITNLFAQTNEFSGANSSLAPSQYLQQIRALCLDGRRMICGKILRVLPDGIVVESGYTDLLRPPLNTSWLVAGSATVTRAPGLVEGREPGSPCVGTIFLTDLPKARGKNPKDFDYVIMLAYPAGEKTYTSVGTIQKTVRRFTSTLPAAVKLKAAEENWATVKLHVPSSASGAIPKLLSQTGAFCDLTNLAPQSFLVPYDLNVPFWSDGAEKRRWVAVPPRERIRFAPSGEWGFPSGTVFVKHFELATDETHPSTRRRLETRLLVCDDTGAVYGVTYKWRADNRDADLLETNLAEKIIVKTAAGTRTQEWYYPSRADCLTCHTPGAGFVLGIKTRQLNRNFDYPSGKTENELVAWKHLGLFSADFSDSAVASFPRLAPMEDTSRSLEDRARSYLDANCAYCHRPGGTVAFFDARYETPRAEQKLLGGRVLIDQRIDGARVVAPNDTWRSILFMRANTTEAYKMPPLARNLVDERGVKLLRQWIEGLPGPRVLPPPGILPPGGHFSKPVEVSLRSEPGAKIFYTLDGTTPTTDDLFYEKPFSVAEPTIVLARAFKEGCTRSIAAKEFFLFNQ
jgi:uncharacterized repeat protein (TIGR03806 family)